MLRFWELDKGSIKIGGVDIRELAYNKLMNYVSFVFQDSFLFSDSIKENILMKQNVSDEVMIEAAKKARCHDFIMKLPNGYDTKIGSGNMKLSGGEVQRIAIARAIVKDSTIIVLDEALAYTDAENENLIQDAIKNLVKNKTVIIIAHRLQSIMEADHIIVLNKGEIIESGTHRTLSSKTTEYKTLWDMQHKADSWAIENKGMEE